MSRELVRGAVAAITISVVLMVINAQDHANDPPTDDADALATGVTILGFAVWGVLRWRGIEHPVFQYVQAIAAGAAIGAVVIGLASVVYDPWAS